MIAGSNINVRGIVRPPPLLQSSLQIPLHCSPSDLMKSQWEVEGDIIDTHPTQLNPTQLQWEPTTLLQGFETKQLLWCIAVK